MAIARPADPFRSYNFRVIATKLGEIGSFSRISGINISVEVAEYREGTDIATVRKLPGLSTYDNVTLERGVSASPVAVDWMKELVDLGNEALLPDESTVRDEITIQVLSRNKTPIREYILHNAIPVALNLGDLDATSSDPLIESLELAYEGLTIVSLTTGGVSTT